MEIKALALAREITPPPTLALPAGFGALALIASRRRRPAPPAETSPRTPSPRSLFPALNLTKKSKLCRARIRSTHALPTPSLKSGAILRAALFHRKYPPPLFGGTPPKSVCSRPCKSPLRPSPDCSAACLPIARSSAFPAKLRAERVPNSALLMLGSAIWSANQETLSLDSA